MKISVVTATYNRADKLPVLYDSLQKNFDSFSDFEWVIMDDGSTDKTEEIVKQWQNGSKFSIFYYRQDNGGKMAAINNAMQYLTGDIVLEIDSDDYLLENSLKLISDDYEELVKKKLNVYGILYKRKLEGKDNSIADDLDNKVIKLFDMHNVYGYDFDMNLTFWAKERKKFSYLLENNEKFVTEARLYYAMDQLYDGMLFRDIDIIVGEYLSDGYSKNIAKVFKSNPYGYFEYFKECLSYVGSRTLFKKRIYFVKHYILFGYLTNKKKRELIKMVNGFNKFLVLLLVIPGYWKSSRF